MLYSAWMSGCPGPGRVSVDNFRYLHVLVTVRTNTLSLFVFSFLFFSFFAFIWRTKKLEQVSRKIVCLNWTRRKEWYHAGMVKQISSNAPSRIPAALLLFISIVSIDRVEAHQEPQVLVVGDPPSSIWYHRTPSPMREFWTKHKPKSKSPDRTTMAHPIASVSAGSDSISS